MRAPVPALALSLSLALGACTNASGDIDWARTAGLAVGIAAVGGLVYAATRERDDEAASCRRRYEGRQLRACLERARRH